MSRTNGTCFHRNLPLDQCIGRESERSTSKMFPNPTWVWGSKPAEKKQIQKSIKAVGSSKNYKFLKLLFRKEVICGLTRFKADFRVRNLQQNSTPATQFPSVIPPGVCAGGHNREIRNRVSRRHSQIIFPVCPPPRALGWHRPPAPEGGREKRRQEAELRMGSAPPPSAVAPRAIDLE